MGKTYGYCRVSTMRQKLQRQIDNIKKVYPDAIIYAEKYTGTKIDRPAFDTLIGKLKAGDRVVFDSVSRMSRTAEDGYELYMFLYEKGVSLTFLKEPMIDTDVYKQTVQIDKTGTDADDIIDGVNKFMKRLARKQIKIAFDQAQKEVEYIHHSISEGLAHTDKHVGRVKGRTYETKKSRETKERIRKMSKDFDGVMNDKECIEVLKISRNSYYKYKREMIEA